MDNIVNTADLLVIGVHESGRWQLHSYSTSRSRDRVDLQRDRHKMACGLVHHLA